MISILSKMSTYKVFTVSGEITANYAIGAAESLKVTVPANWSVVITSFYLKDANARVGALYVGAGLVASTVWSNPFAFSGSTLWIGASGEDVRIVTTGTAGSCYYMLAGYMVPTADLSRITA